MTTRRAPASSASQAGMLDAPLARVALLNANRLDYDRALNFASLEASVRLDRYEATDPDQVCERARGYRILITKELPLPADIVSRLPLEVELICEAGTGYDNVDLGAVERANTERGKMNLRRLLVCNVPDYSTESVAQATLNSILMLSSGTHRLIHSVARGDRRDFQGTPRPRNAEVCGKTLGVIGAGAIGKRVITLARAFRMAVRVFSRTMREWDDDGILQEEELDPVLAASDFISLHCPLDDDTRHLIREDTLRTVKRGAFLINTARGGLVSHSDLVETLASGRLAGAALDVQDPEPLPDDHPLWSRPDVIITPHIGWKTIEARQRLIEAVAGNVCGFLAGKPTNLVA